MSKISKKQLNANRENAKRSTGPKTEEGKSIVRLNALKYGLLARAVVIEGIGATREECDALMLRLQADLAPVGIQEMILVEKIGISYLRIRRVLEAEAGIINCRLNDQLEDEGSDIIPYPVPITDLVEGVSPLVFSYQKDIRGLNTILALLREAESEVAENGLVSEPTQKYLYHVFGRDENSIARKILVSCCLIKNDKEQGEGEAGNKIVLGTEPCKAEMLRELKNEYEHFESMLKIKKESKMKKKKFRRMALSVSTDDESIKLWRYETMIERQCNKYMDQLERLQRRRLGEAVPPPINLNLTADIQQGVQ